MKVTVLFTASLLGLVASDGGGHSSYASLPYENNIGGGSGGGGYGAPVSYGGGYGYDYDDDDYGANFREFMSLPMKAMKGAGKYMRDTFNDQTSKFLELGGSVLLAKGSFLKSSGENLLRHAYNMKKNQGSDYDYYEPSYGYGGQSGGYGVQSGGYGGHSGGPVSPPYGGHSGGHHIVGKAVDHGLAHGGHVGGHGLDAGHGHIGGHDAGHGHSLDGGHVHGKQAVHNVGFGGPKGADVVHITHGDGHGSGYNHVDPHAVGLGGPQSVTVVSHGFQNEHEANHNVIHKRESIQERSARATSHKAAPQVRRDYNAGGRFVQPSFIPVPVPIPVQPSRLVFPILYQQHHIPHSPYGHH